MKTETPSVSSIEIARNILLAFNEYGKILFVSGMLMLDSYILEKRARD